MNKINTPVVILAGGLGTRLREETEFRPKPMVPVGGKPILWHIMKIYASYGFYRFIICLGYKGEMIKHFFLNYRFDGVDFTLNTKTGTIIEHQINDEEWEVTLADTGQDCMTGGRVARIARYIDTPTFLLTYGDGLSDINIADTIDFHQKHGKLVTLSGVCAPTRFGMLDFDGNSVSSFSEKKSKTEEWVNGGFFVCQKDFFKYLSPDNACVLEQEPLRKLAQDGELMMYKHRGFWQCMDTLREQQQLEELWATSAPWKKWNDKIYTPATKELSLDQESHKKSSIAEL